jgi:molybdopterin-containing oxidoreductase family membrane subunit
MLLFNTNSIYTNLFWYGQILLGSLVPLLLIYHPVFKGNRSVLGLASLLVLIGGIVQMYVLIIGGQAYPLEMFPGKEILEGYGELIIYQASLPEMLLGVGGVAVALIAVVFLIKFLPFLPESLADKVADPHHKA